MQRKVDADRVSFLSICTIVKKIDLAKLRYNYDQFVLSIVV